MISKKIMEQAEACKTAEELLTLAKENGVVMTKEEAEAFIVKSTKATGELSDDELDAVAGGGCGSTCDTVEVGTRFQLDSGYRCPACDHEFATVVNIDHRSMHGGSISWFDFECEACHNIFSMKSWYGTVR